jgi:hypothetical protein
MSLVGTSESAQRYTPLARKGYEYCRQIRDRINGYRQMGIEPNAVWLGQDGYTAVRQCWLEVLGDTWDGIIPKWIAGVPCKCGSTGGQDYVIEYTDDQAARDARARSSFKVVDNPSAGLH